MQRTRSIFDRIQIIYKYLATFPSHQTHTFFPKDFTRSHFHLIKSPNSEEISDLSAITIPSTKPKSKISSQNPNFKKLNPRLPINFSIKPLKIQTFYLPRIPWTITTRWSAVDAESSEALKTSVPPLAVSTDLTPSSPIRDQKFEKEKKKRTKFARDGDRQRGENKQRVFTIHPPNEIYSWISISNKYY